MVGTKLLITIRVCRHNININININIYTYVENLLIV